MKRSAVEKTGGKEMKKAILATKVGMTQIFNEDGVLTPVTVLQAGPCVVTQVKTEENDGYKAEGLWRTALSSIAIRVPMVHVPAQAGYLRAKGCLVTWVLSR